MIREAGALEERIKADTVAALKAGDKQRTQALRLLTAALKKERIDAGKTPDEAGEIAVLKRERKRRVEAARALRGARAATSSPPRSATKRSSSSPICRRSSATTSWRRSSTRRSPRSAPPP